MAIITVSNEMVKDPDWDLMCRWLRDNHKAEIGIKDKYPGVTVFSIEGEDIPKDSYVITMLLIEIVPGVVAIRICD